MPLIVNPSTLNGIINAPPSKSYAHRALIIAGLCNGSSLITNISLSVDILATIDCLKKLGASIEINENNSVYVKGPINLENKDNIVLDCKESASTMRFLIPIASTFDKNIKFTGEKSLLNRTMRPILECLTEHNCEFKYFKDNSFMIKGPITPGEYSINSSTSSQFLTGLMLALPLLKSKSNIYVKDNLVSSSYVDITIDILKYFGIDIYKKNNHFFCIYGNQEYIPSDYSIEGDFSQSSFFLTAGALNSNIAITGLNPNSKQGDKKIVDILKKVGANIFFKEKILYCCPMSLRPFDFDATNNPDLVPILCVLAYFCSGKSTISNIERLKSKESDRLSAIENFFEAIGGCIQIKDDKIIIMNIENKIKHKIKTFNDHRIAMSISIFGLLAKDPIIIDNHECVKKSYPNFFDEYKKIGGKIDVVDLE